MTTSAAAIVVAATLAIGGGSANAVAQRGSATPQRAVGVVDGVVTDTGLAPVADAIVTIVGQELRVVTGANGRFRIVSVPAGPYALLLRRIGYEPTTARIVVAEHDTLRLSFALQPATATLDTVTVAARSVSPRLAEFYERRKVGPGQFLTQDEIEKQNAVRASDLFGRFLGLRLNPGGSAAFSTRGGPAGPGRDSRSCPITTIVDGIQRDTNLTRLPSPKEIAAIEFYAGPSQIPLQYKSTSGTWCGLILIWTRDGS
jgi:Carboxypeptidase regulatory-like domain